MVAYHDQIYPKFKPVPDREDARRLFHARVSCGRMAYIAMGAIVPLCLGTAAGLARRSGRATIQAAILGGLTGVALVAVASSVALPAFYKSWEPSSFDMTVPLLTHGVIWSGIGVAGGLAIGLGLGLGGWSAALKAVLGGFVGAAVATVVYEVVGGVAFPTSKTELPLSESAITRAMAPLLVVSLTLLGTLITRASAKTQTNPAATDLAESAPV